MAKSNVAFISVSAGYDDGTAATARPGWRSPAGVKINDGEIILSDHRVLRLIGNGKVRLISFWVHQAISSFWLSTAK